MTERKSNQNTRTSNNLKDLSDKQLSEKYKQTQKEDYFQEMMRRAKPAISAGIKSWGGGNESLSVRARIIAAEALKKYDPEKANETTIKTWVSNNMPKLSRYRDARTAALHIPDTVKRDTQYLSKLRDQHIEEYGVPPSSGWLKDRAGMSEKRFKKANKAFSEAGESKAIEGEAFNIPEEDSDYKMWIDAVYSDLDEPGRKIFEGVSGYLGAPKKQKQQLAKELNISNAAVTNRLNDIQKKLEQYQEK